MIFYTVVCPPPIPAVGSVESKRLRKTVDPLVPPAGLGVPRPSSQGDSAASSILKCSTSAGLEANFVVPINAGRTRFPLGTARRLILAAKRRARECFQMGKLDGIRTGTRYRSDISRFMRLA